MIDANSDNENEEKSVGGKILKFAYLTLINPIIGLALGLFGAFVMLKLYNWFILTVFEFPVLTVWQIWGVLFVLHSVIGYGFGLVILEVMKIDGYPHKQNLCLKEFFTLMYSLLYYLAVWFGGWILHLIIK